MSIQERQNETISIARLASQRLLYSRAKLTRNIEMFLVFLVAFLGLSALAIDNFLFIHWVPVFVLAVWLTNQLVLKRIERNFKTEAANVQEDFDCFVLDLAWPEHKGIAPPTSDRIRQLYLKDSRARGDSARFYNWYSPSNIPRDPIQAVVFCQKMNCWWDVNLRHRWKILLWVVMGSCVFLALILGILTEVVIAEFIAYVSSCIGVLGWGIAEIIHQEEVGQKINGLHRHLTELSDKEQVLMSELRSVQDEIYEHRRTGPLVPDWFYWFYRNEQEIEVAMTEETT